MTVKLVNNKLTLFKFSAISGLKLSLKAHDATDAARSTVRKYICVTFRMVVVAANRFATGTMTLRVLLP